jgi:hypothetical protein
MIFLHAAEVIFHFNDIMNIHPCLEKYLFLLIAQIYMNRVSEHTRYYIAQKSILQESSLSIWGKGGRGGGEGEGQ